MLRTCTKCKISQSIDQFANDKSKKDGKRPSCRTCKAKTDLEYNKNNKDKKKQIDKEYYAKNSEKIKLYAKIWYQNNTERHRNANRIYIKQNKVKILLLKRKWNEKNKEKMKIYMKDYKNLNRSRIYRNDNVRRKYRYDNDIQFRMKETLNHRLRNILKSNVHSLIGCSLYFFKDWIESQFDEKMTWNNRGSYWHLDHIKPVSSFDLTSNAEILKCCHWSNLRPLEKHENFRKGSKIDDKLIEDYKNLSDLFVKKCTV